MLPKLLLLLKPQLSPQATSRNSAHPAGSEKACPGMHSSNLTCCRLGVPCSCMPGSLMMVSSALLCKSPTHFKDSRVRQELTPSAKRSCTLCTFLKETLSSR